MNMTREDGFIAAFIFLDLLWQRMDDETPDREELGSVCSEMQLCWYREGHPEIRIPGDPSSFKRIWKDAMRRQNLHTEPGMSMDEVQAFDVMMEFLNIYQNEGFALQSVIQEMGVAHDDKSTPSSDIDLFSLV